MLKSSTPKEHARVLYKQDVVLTFECDRLFAVACSDTGDLVLGKSNGETLDDEIGKWSGGTRSVDVHDLDGEFKRSISASGTGLYDISCRGTWFVYISDYKAGVIRVYNRMTGLLMSSMKLTIQSSDGICIKDDCLYVASFDENTLYMAKLVHGKFSKEEFAKVDKPIHIDANCSMVGVSCSTLDQVHVFNADGSLRFTYGGIKGGQDDQLNFPCGICIDDEGQTYIADHYNDRIVMLSPDGELRGFIYVTQPVRLALDDYGKMYVVSFMSNSLTVLTLD